ncbi:aminoglycoside phosphotransferase family protein [Oceanobacillus manasiensis]|uniref:aminoglycoside phosphotransferase family protein n=1 Tax=Oceanobacillus manasiensis TaxID=586413 RepID=UPI0005A905A1|nr:aminoglycoside phosphotransferase family protein [Oceanobacillus manasiensis]
MNSKDILKRFGFDVSEEPESIYAFSPVYRVSKGGEDDVIIKKTQRPLDKAERLMDYLQFLKKNKVHVVTPVYITTHNPQQIEEDVYVAYPFIKGDVYTGKDGEIYEAGKLLGKIHELSPKENEYQLSEYDVYDFNLGEVRESIEQIREHVEQYNVPIDVELMERIFNKAVGQQDELKAAPLPHVITPNDYKSNNLIYTPSPYLIDPDNATWIPRIFDLALVLLLFHNELDSAPAEIFTTTQWKLFLEGYSEYIQLTENEKTFWEVALEHVFLDEVMWLMAEVPEDWERPEQRLLFESLVKTMLNHSKNYTL